MPLPKCYHIALHNVPILQQLKLEEALLRNSCDNFCITNYNLPPAIVLGISKRPHDDLFVPAVVEDRIPVIKRFSGGGTVFLDNNAVIVSWILASSNKMPNSRESFDWVTPIYQTIFPKEFSLIENDYVLSQKKIGGNAQYVQRHRWLHHTSFLWNMDSHRMSKYLRIPQQQPKYRNQRTHDAFLTSIHMLFESPTGFIQAVLSAARYQVALEPSSLHTVSKYLHITHRQVTSQLSL